MFTSYLVSIPTGILLGGKPLGIGFSYLIIAPIIHYHVYELKNKNEYYYYYNLGLGHLQLWSSTLLIAFINLLILALL